MPEVRSEAPSSFPGKFSLILNCRNYVEHFLKIRDKDGRTVPLRLNEAQTRLYSEIKKLSDAGKPIRIIVLKARQMGFSTLTEAIIFWMAATHYGCEAMVVAHQEDSTAQLFGMSRRYYDNLPAPLRPMKRASNAQELVFDSPTGKNRSSGADTKGVGLGSSIRCATAGGQGIGRSRTLTALHLSEFAFWPGDKLGTYTGLAQAVPDKPGTMIIIESTANGYDEFKRLWDEAVAARETGGEGFLPLFFAWHEMKEYRREVPPGFTRTAEEEKLAAAYGLDDEQLSWRRWCIKINCGGDVDLFHQEYPSSPEEAFISTGRCAFDKEKVILRMRAVEKLPWKRGEFRISGDDGSRIDGFRWERADNGCMRIFRHPEPGVPYVIGADTAGTGTDYFAAHVLDNRTGEQVAVLHHQFGEREFARQLFCLGKYYNDALIGVETNYSTYPELALEDLGYTRLYVRERIDTYSGKTQKAFGFDTNVKTRPLIVDGLKDVVEHVTEMINDRATLSEMLTFIYDDKWKPQAMDGEHDDLVMSLAIAHFIRSQQSVTAVSSAGEQGGPRWTDDMLEDYYNAPPKMRAQMEKEWGTPNG